jgi:hypothetical protein
VVAVVELRREDRPADDLDRAVKVIARVLAHREDA